MATSRTCLCSLLGCSKRRTLSTATWCALVVNLPVLTYIYLFIKMRHRYFFYFQQVVVCYHCELGAGTSCTRPTRHSEGTCAAWRHKRLTDALISAVRANVTAIKYASLAKSIPDKGAALISVFKMVIDGKVGAVCVILLGIFRIFQFIFII